MGVFSFPAPMEMEVPAEKMMSVPVMVTFPSVPIIIRVAPPESDWKQ